MCSMYILCTHVVKEGVLLLAHIGTNLQLVEVKDICFLWGVVTCKHTVIMIATHFMVNLLHLNNELRKQTSFLSLCSCRMIYLKCVKYGNIYIYMYIYIYKYQPVIAWCSLLVSLFANAQPSLTILFELLRPWQNGTTICFAYSIQFASSRTESIYRWLSARLQ